MVLSRETLYAVAPLVGAWIEMHRIFGIEETDRVAPLVGAWIEIRKRTI